MGTLIRPLIRARSFCRQALLGSHLQSGAFSPLLSRDWATFDRCLNASIYKNLSTAPPVAQCGQSVKFCSILKLKMNKILLKTSSGPGYLDQSVRFILEKDIRVPEVALMADKKVKIKSLRHNLFCDEYYLTNIPNGVKLGKITPQDDEKIEENWRTLLSSQNDEEKAYQDIFALHEDEDNLRKLNIVGLWLAQGLKDVMLPCEVAHRARIILNPHHKQDFTEEQNEVIIDFIENGGTTSKNRWAELSLILGRPRESICEHYNWRLKHRNKLKRGKFTNDEREIIIKKILETDKEALVQSPAKTHKIWIDLSEQLGRFPLDIYFQWMNYIQPNLLLLNAGVHEVDFKTKIVDYCVKNKINFAKEADWLKISQEPEFRGTTPTFLKKVWFSARCQAKAMYPKLKASEINSEILQKYLQERTPRKMRSTDADALKALHDSYQDIVRLELRKTSRG